MLRTLLMGLLALGAIATVLAAIFLVGLMRIQLADQTAPIALAAPVNARPAPAAPAAASVADPAPDPLPPVAIQAIELPAERARLSGNLKLEMDRSSSDRPHGRHGRGAFDPPPAPHQAITHFHDESDAAEWTADITKPGLYEVDLVYASPGPKDKAESCLLSVGDQDLHADILHTRGRDSFQVLTAGNLTLPSGPLTLRFHLSDPSPGCALRLRSIRLIPAT